MLSIYQIGNLMFFFFFVKNVSRSSLVKKIIFQMDINP